MKLSLCVVNYRNELEIQSLLESLQDYPPSCLYEVIVVDNGSTDSRALKKMLADFGDHAQLITSAKNLGFAKASNKAVKKAKGDYVMMCNPDVKMQEGSLKKLLHFAEQQPKEFGLAGAQLLNPDGTVQPSFRRFPKVSDLVLKRLGLLEFFSKKARRYLMKGKIPDQPTKVDWMVGAALLMKKEVFEDIGGFDERFFIFFEDTDLCKRLNEAGYDVWYVPGSQMIHSKDRLSQRGFWPLKKVFWIHLASALKYFFKHK